MRRGVAASHISGQAHLSSSCDVEGRRERLGVRRRRSGRGLDAPSKPSQSFGQGHWHKSSAGTERPLALKKPMARIAMAPSKPFKSTTLLPHHHRHRHHPRPYHGSVGQDNYEPVIRKAFNEITLFTFFYFVRQYCGINPYRYFPYELYIVVECLTLK